MTLVDIVRGTGKFLAGRCRDPYTMFLAGNLMATWSNQEFMNDNRSTYLVILGMVAGGTVLKGMDYVAKSFQSNVLEDGQGAAYYLSKGHSNFDSKKYDKAIKAFKMALDTKPDDSNLVRAYMGLTYRYKRLGEQGQMMAVGEAAFEIAEGLEWQDMDFLRMMENAYSMEENEPQLNKVRALINKRSKTEFTSPTEFDL